MTQPAPFPVPSAVPREDASDPPAQAAEGGSRGAETGGDGAGGDGAEAGGAGVERPSVDGRAESERADVERSAGEQSDVVRVRRPRYQTTPATPQSIIEELRKNGSPKVPPR